MDVSVESPRTVSAGRLPCAFGLVNVLTRAGAEDPARLRQARQVFERMPGYANPLGPYSEEPGPCRESLGNSPAPGRWLYQLKPKPRV